ncbi:MAG: DUF5664 domain-containing protein [Actinomycetota bacterium]|nr:DUF5664 domain-containing protein [Actinomycetota bacterium]
MTPTTTPNPKAARAVADGKAPLDYLEPPADAATARVLRTGAAKYGRRNYRDTDMLITTYVGAIRRHAAAWLSGEDLDPDDGEHHLAHIGACVHVCMGAIDADKMVDDRFVMESLPASDAVHIDGDQDAKAGLTLARAESTGYERVGVAPDPMVCCLHASDPAAAYITLYCYERCRRGPQRGAPAAPAPRRNLTTDDLSDSV